MFYKWLIWVITELTINKLFQSQGLNSRLLFAGLFIDPIRFIEIYSTGNAFHLKAMCSTTKLMTEHVFIEMDDFLNEY